MSTGLTFVEGTGAASDGVDSGMRPATPTSVVSTAVEELFAACIAQVLSVFPGGSVPCIGHMAS